MGAQNLLMMTEEYDDMQYYSESSPHNMGKTGGGLIPLDRAWVALSVVVMAVVVAGWLGLRAVTNIVIPALLGDKQRETCITPRKKRVLIGSSACVQTDISMRTESNWRNYLKDNKYLKRMAKNMSMTKLLVSSKGKKGWKMRGAETEHVRKNEADNAQLKYILLENKESLKERIATLEMKLFETQTRNEGLRESLSQIERKRSASQKDVETYWHHWQATQTLLSDAKSELSTVRRRMRMNDSEASPDGSGEAVGIAMSISGENSLVTS